MLQLAKYRLTTVVSLLQHNGQFADALAQWATALCSVTAKRNKTEDDYEEAARLEWYGSIYIENNKIVLPGRCMDACLINAAKKQRKGLQAKAGLICDANFIIEHDGPEDI